MKRQRYRCLAPGCDRPAAYHVRRNDGRKYVAGDGQHELCELHFEAAKREGHRNARAAGIPVVARGGLR